MTTAIKPRPYQLEALDALEKGRLQEDRRQLVVLPTGSGKTIVWAFDVMKVLEKEQAAGALFMAHRDELINQAVDKTHMVWPEADIGVVKAARNELGHDVTVASVQTVQGPRRLEQLVAARPYSLFYIDEAHHAAAPSYRRIIDAVCEANPDVTIVGLTATPVRADATQLDTVFEKVTYQKSMLDLIEAGYLSDIELQMVDLDISIDGIPVRRGDLKPSDLREVLTQDHIMLSMVDTWKGLADGRRTLAFTVDVMHAHQLCNVFQTRGVAARIVHGETPTEERRAIFKSFQMGNFDVLVNCMIATEGYDDIAFYDEELGEFAPPLDCIMLARPTLSQSLFIQQVGRGTRPAPNKDKLLLLDFSYNSNRHHLVQLPHLFGLEAPKKGQRDGEYTPPGPHEIKSILAAVREAREVDVHQPPPRAGFHWADTDYGFALSLGVERGFLLVREAAEEEKKGRFRVWHFAPVLGEEEKATWSSRYRRNCLTTDPMEWDWAFGLAEDSARELFEARKQGRTMARSSFSEPAQSRLFEREEPWHNEEPTAAQLKLLKRAGKTARTRKEASDAITAIMVSRIIKRMEPATSKQLWYLRNYGIEHRRGVTMGEASRLIQQHKQRQQESDLADL